MIKTVVLGIRYIWDFGFRIPGFPIFYKNNNKHNT
jgi:hypothetical protein